MVSLFIYLFNIILVSIHAEINVTTDSEIREEITKAGVFYSYNETYDIYNRTISENNIMDRSLYKTFVKYDPIVRGQSLIAKRNLCISVEGMLFGLRTAFAWRLVRLIRGFIVHNPPYDLKSMRVNATKYSIQSNLFFSLANYVVSSSIAATLDRTHAIIIKYWLYQAAMTIAKLYKSNLPPRGSPIYRWPEDLYKPDIVLYVNTLSEPVDAGHRMKYYNIKPTLFEVFRRFDVNIVVLNLSSSHDDLVREAIATIRRTVLHKPLSLAFGPWQQTEH